MNTSSINNYYNSNVASVLSSALQGTNQTGNNSSGVSAPGSDSSQLSSFAQLLSTLQQLEQSNPTKYQQVTQQIAANLQSAAQTAQSNGNTSAASQLTQLATDFKNASASGQLPNVPDLAQALGGGGHHHHHSHGGSASSDAAANATSTSINMTALEQALSAFQSGTAQNSSFDPMSIITSTLSNAGITFAQG